MGRASRLACVALLGTAVIGCSGVGATMTAPSAPAPASASLGVPGSDIYLGQKPPGDTPVVFAPGIVSLPDRKENLISFGPDGRTILFSIANYPNSYSMEMDLRNGRWTAPARAAFSAPADAGEASFSPDGSRVYFASTRAGGLGRADIWYAARAGEGWAEPVNLGAPVNTADDEFHPSVASDSSIYYTSSSGDIESCQFADGRYAECKVLPAPINLPNVTSYGDPVIAADGSYMLLRSTRPGNYDIFVSRRQQDGSWSDPAPLPAAVNSPGEENTAVLSPDGKYLFFGRGGDIYWVKNDFLTTK